MKFDFIKLFFFLTGRILVSARQIEITIEIFDLDLSLNHYSEFLLSLNEFLQAP